MHGFLEQAGDFKRIDGGREVGEGGCLHQLPCYHTIWHRRQIDRYWHLWKIYERRETSRVHLNTICLPPETIHEKCADAWEHKYCRVSGYKTLSPITSANVLHLQHLYAPWEGYGDHWILALSSTLGLSFSICDHPAAIQACMYSVLDSNQRWNLLEDVTQLTQTSTGA